MHNKRCCFAGHSKLEYTDIVSEDIIKYAESLIVEYDVKEFM